MTPKIVIESEVCNRCGICIDACPVSCFYEGQNVTAITNQWLCLVCRNCEESCPSKCVHVTLDTPVASLQPQRA